MMWDLFLNLCVALVGGTACYMLAVFMVIGADARWTSILYSRGWEFTVDELWDKFMKPTDDETRTHFRIWAGMIIINFLVGLL